MRALKMTTCILLLSLFSHAGLRDNTKSTFNSFTIGPAFPLNNTSAPTIPATNMKELKTGWEAGWTFFGKPFLKKKSALSDFSFGGKASYSSWRRDSTLTSVTFLGVQGIVRYYMPPIIKPLDIFAQTGGGWFLGEYGFSDADTVDWTLPDFDPVVTKGQNCAGFHIGAGVNIDVVEILPAVTIVATKNDLSIWFALNLGMIF